MAANCGVRKACATVILLTGSLGVACQAAEADTSRTSNAAGTITAQARPPSAARAIRQSYALMSHRAKGATVVDPRLMPAETSATARLRRRVNQRVVIDIRGA